MIRTTYRKLLEAKPGFDNLTALSNNSDRFQNYIDRLDKMYEGISSITFTEISEKESGKLTEQLKNQLIQIEEVKELTEQVRKELKEAVNFPFKLMYAVTKFIRKANPLLRELSFDVMKLRKDFGEKKEVETDRGKTIHYEIPKEKEKEFDSAYETLIDQDIEIPGVFKIKPEFFEGVSVSFQTLNSIAEFLEEEPT